MKGSSLDKVVRGYAFGKGESTLNKYQLHLQFAIWGFREMNLHAHTVTKIKYITVRENNSIPMPTDYVKYSRIAVCVAGRIITLGMNDDLCMPHETDSCGDLKQIDVNTLSSDTAAFFNYGYRYLPHYHNGQYNAGVFGLGGGYNNQGYYRVDEDRRLIWFSSDIPQGQILLEYVSDGINPDGSASIPIEAEFALRRAIDWQVAENDNKVSDSRAERKRQLWLSAVKDYRHLNVMFTEAEYLDMFRGHTDALPKR